MHNVIVGGKMSKKCTKCKQEKLDSEFNKNKKKLDGLQTICKLCSRARSKQYYRDNIDKHKIETIRRGLERKEKNQEKIKQLLQENCCQDCGIKDWRLLEFDHLPQFDKFKTICELNNQKYGWETIKKEINKCEIVCANCHRLRTIARSDQWRNKGV